MKCDTCIHLKFHSAGSWYAVAEGGDDPYNYNYCAKDHWCAEPQITASEEQIGMDDQWVDCKDYDFKLLEP